MSTRSRARPGEAEKTGSLEKLSDAEIVARCAARDDCAWRVLVRRYERLLYTIPYRMGLDPADADEVFQITFLRLAERVDTLKDPSRVRAWLVTTARRVALNLAGRRREVLPEPPPTIADPAELPPDELERMQEQQLVRIALARLGGRCRKLLTLLYYPEDTAAAKGTYEEVADRMGIPVGSIGPTRMRCLKKLLGEFRKLSEE